MVPPAVPTAVVPWVAPEMRAAILAWYRRHGRPLAFRSTDDPWAILVSEAMAQQTQAARAAEAWTRFLARFPTVEALAGATPADALRAWRGLGYNRRALALRQAAIAIVEEHGGRVPADLTDLERLPGVGPYTARAVAALAYGRPVGAVDTNVRRVLGRVLAGDPGALPARTLQAIADAAVPSDQPGTWTHALMDVGATFCHPRSPDCVPCPARPWCAAPEAAGTTNPGRPAPRATRRTTHPASGTTVPARAFEATSRWLRGRILDRLRDEEGTGWVPIPTTFGGHGPPAVEAALAALAREGLAERHPELVACARLPLA